MKYQLLPGTSMAVSSIILGTDYYGKTIPEESAYELLNTFYACGGNMIDTAHVYSDYLPGEKHMSEKVIGRWLQKNDLRSKLYIATKGGFPEIGDMHASRLSFDEIQSDLDESLACLQTNYIDLYWLHRDNLQIPAETITQWMNEFIRQGKIKNYGYSNWTTARIGISIKYAKANGLALPAASQIKWSLATTNQDQIDDDTLVEMNGAEYLWYQENNFPVFAYSSQAKGFFSKIKKENGAYILPDGKAGERYANEQNIQTYEKLSEICRQNGMTPAQGAIAWLLHAPFPVYPIVGCKTKEQLSESLRAAEYSQIAGFMPQDKIFNN